MTRTALAALASLAIGLPISGAAQQQPYEQPYAAQPPPNEQPYVAQQQPNEQPYGAQQQPYDQPYGAQQQPYDQPYGENQAPPPPEGGGGVDVSVDLAAPGASVSFETFRDNLSPYGDWVTLGAYGTVWRPRVAAGWRPYYYGHWTWTDEGWLWVSDEPWGWGPYHYGRWGWDASYGWFWVPGYQWAPAWVTWRYSADVVGWAPLGPGWSLYATTYPAFYNWWTFVPCGSFVGTPVYGVAYSSRYYSNYFQRTYPAPPRASVMGAHAPAWGGPSHGFLERQTGRAIPPSRIVPVNSPGRAGAPRGDGPIPVFRPPPRSGGGTPGAPGARPGTHPGWGSPQNPGWGPPGRVPAPGAVPGSRPPDNRPGWGTPPSRGPAPVPPGPRGGSASYGNAPPGRSGGGGYAAPSAPRGGYAAPPAQRGGYAAPPAQRGGYSAPSAPRGGYAAPSAPRGGYAAPPAQRGGNSPPAHGGGSAPRGGGAPAPRGGNGGGGGHGSSGLRR